MSRLVQQRDNNGSHQLRTASQLESQLIWLLDLGARDLEIFNLPREALFTFHERARPLDHRSKDAHAYTSILVILYINPVVSSWL